MKRTRFFCPKWKRIPDCARQGWPIPRKFHGWNVFEGCTFLFFCFFLFYFVIPGRLDAVGKESSTHSNGKNLNLTDLLKSVIENNLSLKAEKLRIEEQEYDQKIARNLFVPNLKGKISSSLQRYLDSTPMALFGNRLQNNLVSLELVQDYDAMGKANHLQRDLSKLLGIVQKVKYQVVEKEVTKKTVKGFFELAKEVELGKVDQQNLALIVKLHEIAKLNQDLGVALPNDILRIEVQKANIESSLCGRKFKEENILIDLTNLSNQADPKSLNLVLPATLKFPPRSPTFASLTVLLERFDQEIILARCDLEIIETTLKAARSAMLPNVSFSSKFNLNNNSTNNFPSGAYGKEFSMNVALNFPVYDSGDIRNEIGKLDKSEKRSGLSLEMLLKDKRAALNKAWTDYQEILEKIKFSEKALEQSRENMRMVATRYQTGDANIVELVDAQITLSQSAQAAISNFYEERSRLVDLFLLARDDESLKTLDQEPIHEKILADFADLVGN